jgi:ABC-type multidrug transport system permease subunit
MRGFKLYQIIIAPIVVNILVCYVSTILLIVSGVALFRANIPKVSTILLFLIVWLVFAVAIFLIGFVIGTISSSGKAAQSISTVIMFTLMILSGFFMDYNSLPDNIKLFSDLLVTTQANKILVYFWNMEGTSFDGNWFVVIAWLLITSFIVTVKLRKDNLKRV